MKSKHPLFDFGHPSPPPPFLPPTLTFVGLLRKPLVVRREGREKGVRGGLPLETPSPPPFWFLLQMKTMHHVSPKLSEIQMNETSNCPFHRARVLCTLLSVFFDFYTCFPSFPSSQWWSQNLQCFSTKSSKCICDWKKDVSDFFESGRSLSKISPNSPHFFGNRSSMIFLSEIFPAHLKLLGNPMPRKKDQEFCQATGITC